MKHFFYLFVLTFLLSKQLTATIEIEPLHYHTTRKDYALSTTFEMSNHHGSQGSIVKSLFHLTTHYDAYDRYGLYEAQGVCRFFCLGRFSYRATEIDVHDDRGNYVGFIDGQIFTSEPAKFSFYDAEGKHVAIGYLDYNCSGFSIVNPAKTNEILARLSRHFIQDAVDYWDVVIYDSERISPILIKIFAAFACDTQNSFKKDK